MSEVIVEGALDSFADNMVILRNQKGLSQTSISNTLSIPQSTISAFETKKRRPTLEQALMIAHLFGKGIGDLVYRDFELDMQNLEALQPEAIRGARQPISSLPLKRFDNTTFSIYYYSNTDTTGKIRVGNLIMNQQCGKDYSFVSGRLKTEAQEYNCKLVVEHPSYIYIFGNNCHNPERLFIVLNEPRFTTRIRKYQCGVGLMISEGSSGDQFVQKVVVTVSELRYEHYNSIKKWLDMSNHSISGYSLQKNEDKDLYEWYKANYPTRLL